MGPRPLHSPGPVLGVKDLQGRSPVYTLLPPWVKGWLGTLPRGTTPCPPPPGSGHGGNPVPCLGTNRRPVLVFPCPFSSLGVSFPTRDPRLLLSPLYVTSRFLSWVPFGTHASGVHPPLPVRCDLGLTRRFSITPLTPVGTPYPCRVYVSSVTSVNGFKTVVFSNLKGWGNFHPYRYTERNRFLYTCLRCLP